MSLIKQVLQLKQRGESNRGIARQLPINKETVNGYMQIIKANGWKMEDLLQMDDPVLEGMFHAGSPANTDERMKEFLRLLPYFREQLTNRKLHVTRQLLYDEYRKTHPDGYCKSQFYEHLKQNLVAQKDITTVLAMTYKPGEKLMVYYRICGAIIASYRKYEGRLVDLTCRQCLENRVFTYKKFEAILKNNYLHQADDEPGLFAPVPTDHANMRGNGYFK